MIYTHRTTWNGDRVDVQSVDFSCIQGRIIRKIDLGQADSGDAIRIEMNDGDVYMMLHFQDCCESVWLEDIAGDLEDLENHIVELAEEITNHEEDERYESTTWTFYKFRTMGGDVTLRWCGTSNGYYSERVSFVKVN